MAVLILWGYLADWLGRRPILIYTLVGTVIGPALFGLAQNIPQMILFRTIAGAISGSSLIIRTMVADHATFKTQARAFSWFAFAGNLGSFVGPLIGGVLADPAGQYAKYFKGIHFLEKYPYTLPGFAVAGISLTALAGCILFLEETLQRDSTCNEISSSSEGSPKKPGMWSLVRSPGVAASLFVYEHIMLLAVCLTALIPLVLFTPIALGGIGRSSIEISIYFAAQGASQALWLLLVFPFLHRRIGTKGVLRLCAVGCPFLFLGYILMNMFLREGSRMSNSWFWITGSLVCFVGPSVAMSF
jgi:MFS family permease